MKFRSAVLQPRSFGCVTTLQQLLWHKISLKIVFFTFVFLFRSFTVEGVNKRLHILLLIKLEGSIKLCNLETVGQHPL